MVRKSLQIEKCYLLQFYDKLCDSNNHLEESKFSDFEQFQEFFARWQKIGYSVFTQEESFWIHISALGVMPK